MQNVTSLRVDAQSENKRDSLYVFLGAMSGFGFYWLAFSLLFLLRGANVLFFLLYTWPFFLSLLPVAILIGVISSIIFKSRLIFMLLSVGATVLLLFWLAFSLLAGW